MKLLFDENLSPRLVDLLADVYPGSQHVQKFGLGSADDESVWAHAQKGGYVIVSKDSDFANYSMLRGAPPKVIWLRLGNSTTALAEMLLRNSVGLIHRFAEGNETYLVLGRK